MEKKYGIVYNWTYDTRAMSSQNCRRWPCEMRQKWIWTVWQAAVHCRLGAWTAAWVTLLRRNSHDQNSLFSFWGFRALFFIFIFLSWLDCEFLVWLWTFTDIIEPFKHRFGTYSDSRPSAHSYILPSTSILFIFQSTIRHSLTWNESGQSHCSLSRPSWIRPLSQRSTTSSSW